MPSIGLGCCEADALPSDPQAYFAPLHDPYRMSSQCSFRGEAQGVWLPLRSAGGVRELQTFLHESGFFPHGKIDGMCGYRTASALRLFQEYVRSVEGRTEIGVPDGLFGAKSMEQRLRWQQEGRRANWCIFELQATPDYDMAMNLLMKVRRHYIDHPTTLLQQVAAFAGASATRPPASWQFERDQMHLIGVRRNETAAQRQNDDVFFLLARGVVFGFFGTTDPGKSSHAGGPPFLVPGQHEYRFGWHKISDLDRVYRALRPSAPGVLLIRDADRNAVLSETEISGTLEANNSINVHWGGRGVSNWSQGCQVICGKAYRNHLGEVVNCSPFAASTYGQLGRNANDGAYRTKGAYSVLVDLITAFSGDELALPYTLLYECDLERAGGPGADMAQRLLDVLA